MSRKHWRWRRKVELDRASWPVDPDQHLGLMYTELKRYCAKAGRKRFEDLLGDAYEALCDAARTFDPQKGFRFSTHAVRALRWQIGMRHKKQKGMKREGDSGAITRKAPWEHGSIDPKWVFAGEDHRPAELANVRAAVRWALCGMSARERHVLDGIMRGMPLHAIGAELGVCRERARQIRDEALAAARRKLGVQGVVEAAA